MRALFTIAFIIFYCTVSSADEIIIDSGKQYGYAKSCYDNGDYIAAIVELKRYLAFFPEGDQRCDAALLLGMSWYRGGKYGEAIERFREMTETDMADECPPEKIREAWFMQAKAHIASGNPVMAEVVLSNYIATISDTDEQDRARNLIGWIRLETFRWDKAKEAFLTIGDANSGIYQTEQIVSRLETAGAIRKKSPAVAGAAGLIPGGGYLYTGRYQDALVSFLLNGAFAYAAYEAFDHDQNALGGIVSFVGFGFYSGSIYGSISAAHKANRNARRSFIRDLKRDVPSAIQLGVLPYFRRRGLALALQYRF